MLYLKRIRHKICLVCDIQNKKKSSGIIETLNCIYLQLRQSRRRKSKFPSREKERKKSQISHDIVKDFQMAFLCGKWKITAVQSLSAKAR